MELKENFLFDDRYLLQSEIGRGGFSQVWLAKDQWTHLNVAIKIYAPGQGMDTDGMKEFCGELSSVYDLHHSKLLKPQHVDNWQNMPYLIMSYCSNGSCSKYVGKATEEQLWKIIGDVSSGLEYLHSRNVVHQDIKPGNILIDDAMDYLITDFGVSNRARSTLRKSVVSSSSGGTTSYMGPERFSHQPAPTKASDIWSLGATCFELLEGYVPFGEHGGLIQRQSAEIPTINANVSDALKFTITKMLQGQTWDRPTAEVLRQWAANPQAIPVDYSLLNVGSDKSVETKDNTVSDFGNTVGEQTGEQETHRFTDNVKPVDDDVKPVVGETTVTGGGSHKKIILIVVILLAIAAAAYFIYKGCEDKPATVGIDDDDPWVDNDSVAVVADDVKADADTISVSLQSINAPAAGITKTITVFGSNWSVENTSSEMFTVSRDGNTLTVTVHKNNTTSERSDYFNVRNSDRSQDIRIDLTQEGKQSVANSSALQVSSTSVSASASGKTEYITVTCSGSWQVEYPTGTMYSVTRSGNTLTVKINPNTTSSSRTDYFNVKTSDGSKTVRINLSQSAGSSSAANNSNSSAVIDNAWIEHNVRYNGVNSMKFHVKFHASNVYDHKLEVMIHFLYVSDGSLIRDVNGRYKDTSGFIATSSYMTADQSNYSRSDCVIYFPNDELHLPSNQGSVKIKAKIEVYDHATRKHISAPEYLEITYNP